MVQPRVMPKPIENAGRSLGRSSRKTQSTVTSVAFCVITTDMSLTSHVARATSLCFSAHHQTESDMLVSDQTCRAGAGPVTQIYGGMLGRLPM